MNRKLVRQVIAGMAVATVMVGGIYGYYYVRWQHLWQCIAPLPAYEVAQHQDDTLRIGLIGDSWMGMRTRSMDSLLAVRLGQLTDRPVKVTSKGKGGAKSRGIYELMFEADGDGTKLLLAAGLDYCVVSAGINDAAVNLGPRQYTHHLRLIIDFLLKSGIRPVLIDAPDVNIWNIYGGKPTKDLLADYVKSRMAGGDLYDYALYRDAMRRLLAEDQALAQRVILVPMEEWNGNHTFLNANLILGDSIHLNARGYELLDSCLAGAIARDLKQAVHPATVNQPVGRNAQ